MDQKRMRFFMWMLAVVDSCLSFVIGRHGLAFLSVFAINICCLGASPSSSNGNYYFNDFEDKDDVNFWLCGNSVPKHLFSGLAEDAQNNGWFKVDAKGLASVFDGGKAHSGVSSLKLDLTLNSKGDLHGINYWRGGRLHIPLDKQVFLSGYIYPERIPAGVSICLGWHVVHDGIEGNYYIGDVLTTKEGWLFFQVDMYKLAMENSWKDAFLESWYLHIDKGGNKAFNGEHVVFYVDDVKATSGPVLETGEFGVSRVVDGGDDPYVVNCDSLFKYRPINSRNLVDNASFELGCANWQVSDGGTTMTGWIVDNTQSWHGKKSLKIERGNNVSSSVRIRSQIMQVEKGQSYTLSCYAKSERPAQFRMGGQVFQTDDKWRRFSVAVSGRKNYFIDFWQEGTGCAWIDAVQLETGAPGDFQLPNSVELGISSNRIFNVYDAGDPVNMKISVFNATPLDVSPKVKYRLLDFERRCLDEGVLDFPLKPGEGGDWVFKSHLPCGYYKLSASLSGDRLAAKRHEVSFGVIRPASAALVDGDSFFGGGGLVDGDTELDMNRQLLMHSGRNGMKYGIIYHTLYWRGAPKDWRERNPQWDRADRLLELMAKYKVVPVVELWGLPSWASSHGAIPRKLEELDDEVIQGWRDYTYAVVSRYKDRVKHWEVWAEFMHDPLDLRAQMYMRLLRSASEAIRSADPDAVVIGFGQNTAVDWSLVKDLEYHFRLDSLKYVDVVGIHPYGYPQSPEKLGYAAMLDKLQDMIKSYNGGKGKDVWVTEVGWKGIDMLYNEPVYGEGKCYSTMVSELEQAQDMVRMNIISQAKGIRRFLSFSFTSGSINEPWPYSFLNSDGSSPKVVYVAYNQMVNRLAGWTFAREIYAGDNLTCYLFEKKGACPQVVLWSHDSLRKAVELHIELNPAQVRITNMVGTPLSLSADGNLLLTGCPLYMEAVEGGCTQFSQAFESIHAPGVK